MDPVGITDCETGKPAAADLLDTLTRQREAFLAEGAPSLQQRLADLERLRRAIKANATRLATLISSDFGNRSRHESLVADIWPVFSAIRHTAKNLPRWMRTKRVPVRLALSVGHARILYQPLGVVGIISPWNYPFQLAMLPLMTALAAGNRVMLKPSELTPRTSEFLAAMLAELFPAEKVSTVLGDAEVGAAFSRLPFDHLFFTGSTEVGRQVMQAAAKNLTPVTLELGGKSPCIVAEDANLPEAVNAIMYGKLLSAGQTCIAPDYVLLPAAMREEFLRLAGEAVKKFYPRLAGNPDYTSVVNQRHYDRLTQHVAEAKSSGVQVVEFDSGGPPLLPEKRQLPPTIVVDPGDELRIMREEIFGPVLAIKSYNRIEEAIEYINRRPRPLALYYFGAGRALRDEVLRGTTSGGVSVNNTLMHILVHDLPFGGIGASGMGAYHGESGFQTFSHRRGVFTQSRLNTTILLRPPFGPIANFLLKIFFSRFGGPL